MSNHLPLDPGPDPGSDADTATDLVRLASADNFRDVAGPGYATAGGSRVRTGVFFRSNELQLTDEDARALRALGIAAIFDLRGTEEVEAHPDAPVEGTAWEHLEVKGIPMESISGLVEVAEADAAMHGVYRGFVDHEGGRAAFATLLTRLASSEAPQVFHCTAGKDRTGWAAALVLHVAGVDTATILDDYLLTNTISTATRTKYLAIIREHLGEDKVEVYERVMVADPAYLQSAYDAAETAYGSLDGYLRDGLGLTDETLAALRARLVA